LEKEAGEECGEVVVSEHPVRGDAGGVPLGEEWYAFRLRRATGMPFTPRQWHDAALAEVRAALRAQP
jgi:uncharacterized protein (DUF885 family)